MSSHRAPRLALLSLLILSALLLIVAPASAKETHVFSKSFTLPNSGTPLELAINQSTGEVFASTGYGGVVDVFEASGAPDPTHPELTEANGTTTYHFSLPYGVAVDNTVAGLNHGDIYVADYSAGAVLQFDPSGARTAQAPITAADIPPNGTTQSGGLPAVLNNGGLTPTGVTVASNGDVYVSDQSNNGIDIFEPSGVFVAQIGAGHLGGPYSLALDSQGNLYVAEYGVGVVEFDSSGACVNSCTPIGGGSLGVATDSEDHVYSDENNSVTEFNSSAEPIDSFGSFTVGRDIAVKDTSGDVYVADEQAGQIDVFEPIVAPNVTTGPIANLGKISAKLTGDADPAGGGNVIGCHFEYGPGKGNYSLGSLPCLNAEGHEVGTAEHPIASPTEVHADPTDLTTDTTYHYRLVASNKGSTEAGQDRSFETLTAVEGVSTSPPTDVSTTNATLNGSFVGDGEEIHYYFEYGIDATYGTKTEENAAAAPTGHTEVSVSTGRLGPGSTYHYRIVVTNELGTTYGQDETVTTASAPTINGVSSSHVTATSADLSASINPRGVGPSFETRCRFEYGQTTSYGTSVPCPEPPQPLSGTTDQTVQIELTGLQGLTYHFRFVAENTWGTTTSEDQTFNFYPPSCPNANVRQQTQAAYLPDCRAYELVSPPDAGSIQLFPGGPSTGYATSPSRFAYVGANGTLAEAGGSPIDGNGDLYVATRTDSGWVSRYVGLPSSEAAVDGGPAMGPPASVGQGEASEFDNEVLSNGDTSPSKIQSGVLTDPGMESFLEFDDGNQGVGTGGDGDLGNRSPVSSNAPYVYGAEGSLRGRWPTNLGAVSPAPHALDCRVIDKGEQDKDSYNDCPGDVTASSDLTHFVFASEWNVFAPDGQLSPPGSVYDDATATASVEVASKLPGGEPIPPQPTDQAGDPLQIPAVSADGSHILIAAGGTGPCGSSTCPEPPCGITSFATLRCPMQPSNLYMRVDDAITIDISRSEITGKPVDVNYLGMTSDGSKVYFTSEEHLTKEDPEHGGTSLYMWSKKGEEEAEPITLISKGVGPGDVGEPGNTDECHPALDRVSDGEEEVPWTAKCGVVPYSGRSYCKLPGGLGGNCISDNSIASESGDVLFFSPEQLDGARGIPNQWNLYDYRGGRDHFVASFTSGVYCFQSPFTRCSNTPVVRMQVTSDGSHVAFVTASQVTHYDNAGHLEMYTYEPSTERIVCVSCNPSGAPATSDVSASQDGLFLTEDGRTFFSTEEALVHDDTNHAQDVYEYVEGRPQLITPGTGDTRKDQKTIPAYRDPPGLASVSANGTDVYFSTYDTFVPRDLNGNFLKFYDARTGGGFPSPAPSPPCEAADECHGAGSASPPAIHSESSASLKHGNANFSAHHKDHKKKHQKRKSHKKHHTRHANRGGGK